jgi:hypothetical protein
VYLHNVTGWTFDDIASSGMPSYGVAVSASSRNTFEDITIDRAGMGTTNPGLNLDAGTSHNHFVTTTITGMTVGVLIGGSGAKDPGGQVGNVGNHFGTVTLDHESFAAISIPGGRDNLFKTVDATDITSIYPPPDRAQVRLYGAYTRDNRIDEYNSLIDADRAPHHEAFYVIYADKYATGNTVTLGTVDEPGSYSVARWRDANGHNTFT